MSSMKDIRLTNSEQLGRAVRIKRKEQGLSQSALAELLKAERKWVMRLEAGNPGAELALVLRALDVLGIRVMLHDESPPGKTARTGASRLDEVFERLQGRK